MDTTQELREYAESHTASSSDTNLLSGVSVAQILSSLSVTPNMQETLEFEGHRAMLNNWIRIARELKSLSILLDMESIALILAGDVHEVFSKVLRPLQLHSSSSSSSSNIFTSSVTLGASSIVNPASPERLGHERPPPLPTKVQLISATETNQILQR